MARLPDTTRTERAGPSGPSGAPDAVRGRFWRLFGVRRATEGAGERPDAPDPDRVRSAGVTPPGALPPWQYRPGWDD